MLTIDDIRLNCFTYLGFRNFDDVDWLTFNEYSMLMEAYQLRRVDELGDIALAAWWHQAVKSTKGSGKNIKPQYRKLDELFDHDAMVDDIKKMYEPGYEPKSHKRVSQSQSQIIAKRMAEFHRLKKREGVRNG